MAGTGLLEFFVLLCTCVLVCFKKGVAMINALLDSQLMITVNNKVGTLAEISSVISASNINLIAISAYAVDNVGHIVFVTENNAEAKKLLKAKKYEVREEKVVLVTLGNKPGALQKVTTKIAQAGIDLTFLYGSVEKEGIISRVVMISEDNQSLLLAIRT